MKGVLMYVLSRFTWRAASFFIAFLLVSAGIVMCWAGLKEAGQIDLATPVVTGKIATGSLGLLVVFVGVFLALVTVIRRRERIEFSIRGRKVVFENVSYRKIEEVQRLLDRNSTITPVDESPAGPRPRTGSTPAHKGEAKS
jgi:TRAP-type C4-dicarboxylate transport system permease small subunit